ncbi:sulfurtransferase [Sphingomonas sp.]|uniref:sulfurtransferase n=1 Tax=Sphingomonas sp. TaxID=28214 RepID=UPI0035AEF6B9
MDALLTPQALAALLDATDVRLLDATHLLGDPGGEQSRRLFDDGHIPGARFMDLDHLVDPDTSLPMMMPSPERFAAAMAALGVGTDDRIVVYDQSPLHSAARGWWMLRSFGASEVAILDGGLAAWRAAGLPIEQGAAPDGEPGHFVPRPPAAHRRTLPQMQANLTIGAEQVVDARSPARFAGAEAEPRAGVVPGHIPGSQNLHYARLFDADGRWKRGPALAAAFADAGVDFERPVIATCGSGITAAVLAFGAHLLGHPMTVYDGSWAEWGSHPDTPKAKD